jgi:hypothetical protein
MGGIGKTALAVQLVEQIHSEFDSVVWRSLTPPPDIPNALVQISPGVEIKDLSTCLDYFSSHRCLIVLDAFETVLQDNPVGSYREGYEVYGELLQRIGNERHQSCLLVISREQPQDLHLNDEKSPIRQFKLGELQEAAQILLEKKLLDVGENWRILIKTYGGNPLALQVIATMIRDLFGGSVREFLKQNTTFFDRELRSILSQQFDRLSAPEKEALLKLASTAQPFSLGQLLPLISSIASTSELIGVLRSLQHRSLIEQQFGHGEIRFTLPQVIMKFAQKI